MIPVLAPPRSCSSLITAMLGQHPELYATAELECFTSDTLAGCLSFCQRVPIVTAHGLLRSVAQLLCGEQSNTTIATAQAWLAERQSWSGAQLVRWIEAQIAPRRLLDKSPIHALRWESLQRLALVAEDEPILHLTRHPLTALKSLKTAYSRNGQALNANEALRAWLHGHHTILRWIDQQSRNQALLVRSEELLVDPEGQLERMCLHLGVSAAPHCIASMLLPELSPYAMRGPTLAPTGNDPHWLESPALRRSLGCDAGLALARLWEVEELDPMLVFQAMALSERLGYT